MRFLQCIKTVVTMELASKNVHLGGYCNHEYLSVKKTLLKMLQDKTEENVQLCVYVDGECVVDLCGTSTGDFGHDRDKLQVHFLVKFLRIFQPILVLDNIWCRISNRGHNFSFTL